MNSSFCISSYFLLFILPRTHTDSHKQVKGILRFEKVLILFSFLSVSVRVCLWLKNKSLYLCLRVGKIDKQANLVTGCLEVV